MLGTRESEVEYDVGGKWKWRGERVHHGTIQRDMVSPSRTLYVSRNRTHELSTHFDTQVVHRLLQRQLRAFRDPQSHSHYQARCTPRDDVHHICVYAREHRVLCGCG